MNTNKNDLIKAEVVRLQNELIQEKEKGFGSDVDDACILELQNVLTYIDSLQEEPVSEELEEASKEWLAPQLDKSYANYGEVKMMELTHFDGYAMLDAIEFGAQWQEEHQWISVKDRLPKEEFDDGYTLVFVYIQIDEHTGRFDVDYIRNNKWELHPDSTITHWMPIPIPNKED